eukprot:IDg1843t1
MPSILPSFSSIIATGAFEKAKQPSPKRKKHEHYLPLTSNIGAAKMMRPFVTAALLIVLVQASLASTIPSPVCFTKTQTCCFKYSSCGFVTKKIRVVTPCPFSKCKNVCHPVCEFVPIKVPKKVCFDKKVVTGETCKEVKVLVGHHYVWKNECKPKYVIKHVCETEYTVVKKEVCKDVCKKKCKIVKANCIKFNVLKFLKYCPRLSCSRYVTSGSTTKPADFVEKKGKIVNMIEGGRKIFY